MPRPRSYVIRNGKTIDGVSYHVEGGYYIISGGKRQYFGKTDAALQQAKATYDQQSGGVPKTLPALTPTEAQKIIDVIESAGVDTTRPQDAPEWANELADSALAPHKLNPEWAAKNPQATRDHIATKFLRVDPAKWERHKNRPPTVNPDGKEITVRQVGQIYLRWYVSDKGGCNIDELEQQAEAEKTKLAATLADLENRQEQPRGKTVSKAIKRDGQSKKRAAKITALRRKLANHSWVEMLPRKYNRGYREVERYFNEFADFIEARHNIDLPIAYLTGDDLRAYYDHVRVTATTNKDLSNPDKWRNLRYQSVSTAFRRVKKIYPDAALPQGFFGVDGTLAILECRKTVTEAEKITLTPAEFAALVKVADTQWQAILFLSMNAALENESVSQIQWEHIDFTRKLMIFPRPKNGRIRQTPLAPQTLAALKAWKQETTSTLPNIFVTPQGGEWLNGTDSLGKHFNLLKDKVKQTTQATIPATFKAIRKTASSTVMAATKNELAVDMLLGHAPAKSWRHYVGFAPDFLQKGVKAIERKYLAVAAEKEKTPKTA